MGDYERPRSRTTRFTNSEAWLHRLSRLLKKQLIHCKKEWKFVSPGQQVSPGSQPQTCLQWTTLLTPSLVLQPDSHTNSLKNAFQLVSILNWLHPAHKVSVLSTSVCGVAFWAPHPNSQAGWPGYLSSNSSETRPTWVALPTARLQLARSTQPAKNMVSRRWRYHQRGYHLKKVEVQSRRLPSYPLLKARSIKPVIPFARSNATAQTYP